MWFWRPLQQTGNNVLLNEIWPLVKVKYDCYELWQLFMSISCLECNVIVCFKSKGWVDALLPKEGGFTSKQEEFYMASHCARGFDMQMSRMFLI